MTRQHHNYRTGFTLMDLLIVCVIVVILGTALLAAVAQAKQYARLAVCMNNQRQIGEQTNNFMSDFNWRFPSTAYINHAFHPDILICPEDLDPVELPDVYVGRSENLLVSYGLNIEYAQHAMRYEDVPSPETKALSYDGYGWANGLTSSFSGYADGRYDGNLFMTYHQNGQPRMILTHFPPGNPTNAKSGTYPLSALNGHVKLDDPLKQHVDLPGAWTTEGGFSVVNYSLSDFDPRHMNNGVGAILFVDGHVETAEALDKSMFVYDDSAGGGG